MIRKSGKYFADWYGEAGRREQRVARHGCEETGSGLVAGTWIATAAPLIIEPGSVIDFTGTFNSTSSPLSIPPSVSVERQRGASSQTNFSLMGNASVMNWSCVTSLTLSGQAIGDAFSVTDAVNKVDIIALPSLPSGNSFNFSYKFEPTAASCPGDYGRGVLTINSSPWDY